MSVGLVANPVSARDIRRVIANATSLQVADRANIVMRVLAAVRSCGVKQVLMMPENGGICRLLKRGLQREQQQGDHRFPELEMTNTPISGTVDDTFAATQAMVDSGVKAIVVLGGDGTHRAVAKVCGQVPIAGISTGTNNAFPEHREPTITGLAVGLVATGRIPESVAFTSNKLLRVEINGGERRDIALVDVVVSTERYVGARALWRTENLRELFVTFSDPEVIGMSAIAGLLEPVRRNDSGGLHLLLEVPEEARIPLQVPIAPGLIRTVGVQSWQPLEAGIPVTLKQSSGMIALDGERELEFGAEDTVQVTLHENAFRTVDVGACMRYTGKQQLLVGAPLDLLAT
ncbi:MAG: acetoin catabolism protein X [Deltaproteobacteria bacterium]|nr:acetoin catabolism protein X [Deltaproteobacteria bacterium]MBQ32741.1 acetoin catabolism protein X [Deltaproteobacteria bacterium]